MMHNGTMALKTPNPGNAEKEAKARSAASSTC
jgi:hypothetical protein